MKAHLVILSFTLILSCSKNPPKEVHVAEKETVYVEKQIPAQPALPEKTETRKPAQSAVTDENPEQSKGLIGEHKMVWKNMPETPRHSISPK